MRLHIRLSKHSSIRLASLLLATAVSATSMYSLQSVYASRKTEAQDAKQRAESSLSSVTNDINNITYRQQTLRKEKIGRAHV